MRTLTYYVASTIDGFIAAPDGDFDFFPVEPDLVEWISRTYPETIPTHLRLALGLGDVPNRTFDTVVMGRGTYAPGPASGFPSPYSHLRQYVFAHGLAAPDDVTVVEGDPVAFVRELKAQDGSGIYLAGGGDLAGQLRGEIDELVVKLNPLLAGAGVPVLRHEFAPQRLTLTAAEPLPSGVVVLRYRRDA